MSITETLSAVRDYNVGMIKSISTTLANPKITALAIAILSTYSLPTASAVEIGCMITCSTATLVHPVAAVWWAQCMQFCSLLGFAPTP